MSDVLFKDFKAWVKAEYPDAYTFISMLDYWENKFYEEVGS